MFEKIMCKQLNANFRSAIHRTQHGFLKGKSTLTNLTEYCSSTLCLMEKGNQIDAIYTDFSKAFDKVDHALLIYKLRKLGLAEEMTNWLASYLNGRTQTVRLENYESRPIIVRSSVPQGSHLGPLLFLVFINDLFMTFNNVSFLFYADDLKFFRVVNSLNDAMMMQNNVNDLNVWCDRNGMLLNVKKCSIISFCRRKIAFEFDYEIQGNKLERLQVVKDLGVFIDTKMSFKFHVNLIIARANSKLGMIKRFGKDFKEPYVLKALYCSLVRSTLEYGSVVWMPHYEIHVNRIESVQKQFLLFCLRNLGWSSRFDLPSYVHRLRLINLLQLSDRRKMACCLFVFDLLSGKINSDFLLTKFKRRPRIYDLRHPRLLYEELHTTNYGMNEPINRCCMIFNQFRDLYTPSISRTLYRDILTEKLKNES